MLPLIAMHVLSAVSVYPVVNSNAMAKALTIPSFFFGFATEENSNVAMLSSGKNGCPVMEMTLTSYCYDAEPVEGATVNFEIVSGSSKIEISNTSQVSDNTGRCYITVKAKSNSDAGNGDVVEVRATWLNVFGLPLVTESILLELRHDSPSGPNTQSLYSKFPDGLNIKYSQGSSPSWIQGPVDKSRADWSIPGDIAFSSAGSSLPQIVWGAAYNSDGPDFAKTEETHIWLPPLIDIQLQRTIRFNRKFMNGDPTVPPYSWYAPISKRHHAEATANHELGHAIFLDHNPGKFNSLMFPTHRFYWVHKTIQPTIQDTSIVKALYP